MCQSSVPNMILTVTLNAAIDKRYVVEGYQVGEVNRVKECAYTPGGRTETIWNQERILSSGRREQILYQHLG